jgi:Holliday junction resolvase RusA-like endonuclease
MMAGWWVGGMNPKPQGSFIIMHVPGKPKAHFPKYPDGLIEWRRHVHDQSRAFWKPTTPIVEFGPVDLFLRFAYEPEPHQPKAGPDLDKLVRGVMDALKGVAFKDDRQVVRLTASKGLASEQSRPEMGPGVYITVQAHDEENAL